jgi:hypothetical protein
MRQNLSQHEQLRVYASEKTFETDRLTLLTATSHVDTLQSHLFDESIPLFWSFSVESDESALSADVITRLRQFSFV